MSDFVTSTTTALYGDLDPTKHVNFTFGMVLGEQDFNQQFAFHDGRDHWYAREAIGYGVLRGLEVSQDLDGDNGPRLLVAPGVALTPQGQLVCVNPAQCAVLNAWLEDQRTKGVLEPHVITDEDKASVRLFVVLCYRTCLTDNVPIPGEPCRSEDLAMAASRIRDDFQLELRYAPPAQLEEDGVRAFAAWVKAIKSGPAGPSDLAAFRTLLRKAFVAEATATPPPLLLEPAPSDFTIPAGQELDYYRAALTFWTTSVRPADLAYLRYSDLVRRLVNEQPTAAAGASPTSADEFGANLIDAAKLDSTPASIGYLDPKAYAQVRVAGDPANRTVLLEKAAQVWQARIRQVWVTAAPDCNEPPVEECLLLGEAVVGLTAEREVAVATSPPAAPLITITTAARPLLLHQRMLQEWLLADIRTAEATGSALAPATQVSAEQTWNIGPATGTSTAYAREDHTHGTPDNPVKNHLTNADGLGFHAVGGDLAGDVNQAKVVQLQGVKIADTAPGANQVLAFVGDAWTPQDPPAATGGGPAAATQPPSTIDWTTTPDVGTSVAFAREDHTHGTPDNPVKAHIANDDNNGFHKAGGDVDGTLDNLVVKRLQQQTVSSQPPNQSDVLTYDGTQWVPAQPPSGATGGPFVVRPRDVKRFSIVAAGIVSMQATSPVAPGAPVAGGLIVTRVDEGRVSFIFDEYKQPNEKHQYVVKALLVFSNKDLEDLRVIPGHEESVTPVVTFEQFEDEGVGFALSVTERGKPVNAGFLQTLEFMIEVSELATEE